MRAIVQCVYGSPDVLRPGETAVPVAAHDQVLVRVRGSSVNFADWASTSGVPLIGRVAFGLRRPKHLVPGKDVAGQVEAVGASVTRFRIGDEVYGEAVAGAYAEYVAVPERLLAIKPATLSFEQAAAVPLAGQTALQGMRDAGKVRAGQRVLVNGASGGVGIFALQIAKARGTTVTAVCSTRNAPLALSLGADRVIDYSRQDFTTLGERYDVIFDLVGNHTLAEFRGALTRRGTLVLSSGTGGRMLGPIGRIARAALLSPFVGQSLVPLASSPKSANLDELRELIDAGAVTPSIDRTYPLEQVPEAMRDFVENHPRAKIVISV